MQRAAKIEETTMVPILRPGSWKTTGSSRNELVAAMDWRVEELASIRLHMILIRSKALSAGSGRLRRLRLGRIVPLDLAIGQGFLQGGDGGRGDFGSLASTDLKVLQSCNGDRSEPAYCRTTGATKASLKRREIGYLSREQIECPILHSCSGDRSDTCGVADNASLSEASLSAATGRIPA